MNQWTESKIGYDNSGKVHIVVTKFSNNDTIRVEMTSQEYPGVKIKINLTEEEMRNIFLLPKPSKDK